MAFKFMERAYGRDKIKIFIQEIWSGKNIDDAIISTFAVSLDEFYARESAWTKIVLKSIHPYLDDDHFKSILDKIRVFQEKNKSNDFMLDFDNPENISQLWQLVKAYPGTYLGQSAAMMITNCNLKYINNDVSKKLLLQCRQEMGTDDFYNRSKTAVIDYDQRFKKILGLNRHTYFPLGQATYFICWLKSQKKIVEQLKDPEQIKIKIKQINGEFAFWEQFKPIHSEYTEVWENGLRPLKFFKLAEVN